MTRNFDDGQQTDVRIMEFSKAFDKVSHNFLTHNLKHYGIRQGKQLDRRFARSKFAKAMLEGV
jgi:hypothetical protein